MRSNFHEIFLLIYTLDYQLQTAPPNDLLGGAVFI